MRCPMCGQADLVHDTRDLPYSYKGQTTLIKGMTGDYCDACDDAIFSYDETGRLSQAMADFRRKIDAY
ncbi:XRE family transcriptional regulator [Pseudomonas luteola]|uniref:XRE family transcriptional regulator n=4 Tax=Pseudomonas TaxID=286 RepID=A0A2X2CCW0_PSELU|nr:type II toxin-antitoxin system MqsA family antitoxin [Pseudomonas luteola]SER22798.1 HTH-type transcriptional regulator / antitoxin MqsA [Pseudomonas lutea]SPZ04973.1 XRE family transcriptional regulator [Pseudomonas luteola]